MCWASAALPPVPMMRSLLPARSAVTMASAILRAVASSAASRVARSKAASDCFRWAPIRSLESWLKTHRQGCEFESVVMIASRPRKLAKSRLAKSGLAKSKLAKTMRNACPGLGQHALGGGNDVGRRNVPHAAMVVHGADGTMAGLARHHRLGLHGRCQAIQRRPVIGAGGAENAHGRRPQGGCDMHQAGLVRDRDIARPHRQDAIAQIGTRQVAHA